MSVDQSEKANNCESKRGFFTLYNCPKPAASQCSECCRNLCAEHLPKEASICLECQAQKHVEQDAAAGSENLLLQSYHLRHVMMSEASYKPIYLGDSLTDYYSSYDVRAFDVELASIADMADSPDELFFDS